MDLIKKENIPHIITFVVVILGALVFISMMNINLNPAKPVKKVKKIVTIEGFDSTSEYAGFCEKYQSQPHVLEEQCNALTKDNCNDAACCVLLKTGKCVAGHKGSPIYKEHEQQHQDQPLQQKEKTIHDKKHDALAKLAGTKIVIPQFPQIGPKVSPQDANSASLTINKNLIQSKINALNDCWATNSCN